MRFCLVLIVLLPLFACATPGKNSQLGAHRGPKSLQSLYGGCMLFVDDVRLTAELNLAREIGANALIRSWYRFGDPGPDKAYSKRAGFVQSLRDAGILLGGGSSLSVLSSRDLESPDFDSMWLSRTMSGEVLRDGE